jgi:hypothetical protein
LAVAGLVVLDLRVAGWLHPHSLKLSGTSPLEETSAAQLIHCIQELINSSFHAKN